jgi:hypothetical protein
MLNPSIAGNMMFQRDVTSPQLTGMKPLQAGRSILVEHMVRFRSWVETVMASCMAILLLVTFVCQDWIERMFGLDPDRGNGSIEWVIAAVLAVSCISFFAVAAYKCQRAQILGR